MIFLDTGFVFALVYADNVHHARVTEVPDQYRGRPLADFVLTTNHVIAGTVTLLRKKAGPIRGHGTRSPHGLESECAPEPSARCDTRRSRRSAQRSTTSPSTTTYSFVDCLSFVLMEKLGIREAFTVDGDFTHRFVALPGPLPK